MVPSTTIPTARRWLHCAGPKHSNDLILAGRFQGQSGVFLWLGPSFPSQQLHQALMCCFGYPQASSPFQCREAQLPCAVLEEVLETASHLETQHRDSKELLQFLLWLAQRLLCVLSCIVSDSQESKP